MSAEIFYLHRPAVERPIQRPFLPHFPPVDKPKNHAEEIMLARWKYEMEKRNE